MSNTEPMKSVEKIVETCWKQHVKDMERFAFKDPQKYYDAFTKLVTTTLHSYTASREREIVKKYHPAQVESIKEGSKHLYLTVKVPKRDVEVFYKQLTRNN